MAENVKNPQLDELTKFQNNFSAVKESIETWQNKKEEEIKEISKAVKNSTENFILDELSKLKNKNSEEIENIKNNNVEFIDKTIEERFKKFDVKFDDFIESSKKNVTNEINKFIKDNEKNFAFINELKEKVTSITGELDEVQTKFSIIRRDYEMFNQQIKNGFENGLFPQSIVERLAKLEENIKQLSNT